MLFCGIDLHSNNCLILAHQDRITVAALPVGLRALVEAGLEER